MGGRTGPRPGGVNAPIRRCQRRSKIRPAGGRKPGHFGVWPGRGDVAHLLTRRGLHRGALRFGGRPGQAQARLPTANRPAPNAALRQRRLLSIRPDTGLALHAPQWGPSGAPGGRPENGDPLQPVDGGAGQAAAAASPRDGCQPPSSGGARLARAGLHQCVSPVENARGAYRRAAGLLPLLVDSTGIRFLGDGGWQARKQCVLGRRVRSRARTGGAQRRTAQGDSCHGHGDLRHSRGRVRPPAGRVTALSRRTRSRTMGTSAPRLRTAAAIPAAGTAPPSDAAARRSGTPKGLRHTVATTLREAGLDERTIADLLGQKHPPWRDTTAATPTLPRRTARRSWRRSGRTNRGQRLSNLPPKSVEPETEGDERRRKDRKP